MPCIWYRNRFTIISYKVLLGNVALRVHLVPQEQKEMPGFLDQQDLPVYAEAMVPPDLQGN